jgi:hypothetical protein
MKPFHSDESEPSEWTPAHAKRLGKISPNSKGDKSLQKSQRRA